MTCLFRRAKNREAARKSRERKMMKLDNLQKSVLDLQHENQLLAGCIAEISQQAASAEAETRLMQAKPFPLFSPFGEVSQPFYRHAPHAGKSYYFPVRAPTTPACADWACAPPCPTRPALPVYTSTVHYNYMDSIASRKSPTLQCRSLSVQGQRGRHTVPVFASQLLHVHLTCRAQPRADTAVRPVTVRLAGADPRDTRDGGLPGGPRGDRPAAGERDQPCARAPAAHPADARGRAAAPRFRVAAAGWPGERPDLAPSACCKGRSKPCVRAQHPGITCRAFPACCCMLDVLVKATAVGEWATLPWLEGGHGRWATA